MKWPNICRLSTHTCFEFNSHLISHAVRFAICLFRTLFVSQFVYFTRCSFRNLFISHAVCFAICLTHTLFVSQFVYFTRCSFHNLFTSHAVRFAFCLFHTLFISPLVYFTRCSFRNYLFISHATPMGWRLCQFELIRRNSQSEFKSKSKS